MAEIRVGIIGTGGIGRDHAKRLTNKIAGCKVTAVSEVVEDLGRRVAEEYNCQYFKTGEELINYSEVDAIVIASINETHAQYVLESLKAGKPVFCEKPLATTAAESKRIMDEELKIGKRLVQVGFMRRFDKDYRDIKKVIDSGEIGEPLLVHATHRNMVHSPYWTSNNCVDTTGIHDIDILRWLLEEEYESCQLLTGKLNSLATTEAEEMIEPQMMILKTKKGTQIDVEINMTAPFGYDIQCEVVGEKGLVRLPDPSNIIKKINKVKETKIPDDWFTRFIDAYDVEFQEWIDRLIAGKECDGPSVWDGYVASVTIDAVNESRRKGGSVININIGEKPSLYK